MYAIRATPKPTHRPITVDEFQEFGGTEKVNAVVSRTNTLQCIAAPIQSILRIFLEERTSALGVNEGKTNTYRGDKTAASGRLM